MAPEHLCQALLGSGYEAPYTAAERKETAKSGQALPDGSYPIKTRKISTAPSCWPRRATGRTWLRYAGTSTPGPEPWGCSRPYRRTGTQTAPCLRQHRDSAGVWSCSSRRSVGATPNVPTDRLLKITTARFCPFQNRGSWHRSGVGKRAFVTPHPSTPHSRERNRRETRHKPSLPQ